MIAIFDLHKCISQKVSKNNVFSFSIGELHKMVLFSNRNGRLYVKLTNVNVEVGYL